MRRKTLHITAWKHQMDFKGIQISGNLLMKRNGRKACNEWKLENSIMLTQQRSNSLLANLLEKVFLEGNPISGC